MRVLLTLTVLGSIFLCACSVSREGIPNQLWKDLDVYTNPNNFQKAIVSLKELQKNQANRKAMIRFLSEKLKSDHISHKDQLRLGFLFMCLQRKAQGSEHEELCRIISLGKKHRDFYPLALPYTTPPYFLTVIEVFQNEEDLIAYAWNPDGAFKDKYIVQEFVLVDLQDATGQGFGRDYEKWKDWWQQQGQYLHFDQDTETYQIPAIQ